MTCCTLTVGHADHSLCVSVFLKAKQDSVFVIARTLQSYLIWLYSVSLLSSRNSVCLCRDAAVHMSGDAHTSLLTVVLVLQDSVSGVSEHFTVNGLKNS